MVTTKHGDKIKTEIKNRTIASNYVSWLLSKGYYKITIETFKRKKNNYRISYLVTGEKSNVRSR